MKKFFPQCTVSLITVLSALFIVDLFWVSADIDFFSLSHLIEGDKTGYLTASLKLISSKVKEGQIWRLFTPAFLHAGIPHIVFNIVALLNIGYLFEKQEGPGATLFAFIFSGAVSATLMMVLVHMEDGLGASTAIFGLLGAFIMLNIFRKEKFGAFLKKGRWYNWALIILMVLAGSLPGKIVLLEHATGFFGGILAGIILFLISRFPQKKR